MCSAMQTQIAQQQDAIKDLEERISMTNMEIIKVSYLLPLASYIIS
jgi:hypothetical protein